jgi:glucose repression regulatory protein TUP1
VHLKEIRHTLTGHTDNVYSLEFAGDSRTLATGSTDGTVRLWDTEAGSQIVCLTTDSTTISSVAISPDMSFVAAGCCDKSIQIWSTATGLRVGHFKGQDGHAAAVSSLAFSPNGKGLVSGSLDRTVKLWDLDTSRGNHLILGPESGRCYETFEDHGVS